MSIIPLEKKVYSSAGSFDLAAELPVHRTEASGAVCKQKFYVLGGLDYLMRTYSDMWMYDAVRKVWIQQVDLPAPLNHAGVVSNDSLVFVVGGFGPLGLRYRGVNIARYTPQNTLFSFNPITHSWTRLANLPEVRGAGAVAILNDTIYYAGGIGQDLKVQSNLWAYVIKSNKWLCLKSFQIPRDHHRLEIVNRCLYLISGRQDDLRKTLISVEKYNLDSKEWTSAASLPSARGGLSSVVFKNKIYVFGGEFVWSCSNEVDCYDPRNDSWSKIGILPEARHGIISGVIDDTIHLISGGRHSRVSVSGIHRTFVPNPNEK